MIFFHGLIGRMVLIFFHGSIGRGAEVSFPQVEILQVRDRIYIQSFILDFFEPVQFIFIKNCSCIGRIQELHYDISSACLHKFNSSALLFTDLCLSAYQVKFKFSLEVWSSDILSSFNFKTRLTLLSFQIPQNCLMSSL